MSLQDSAVIFFLALLLFGPRKLPELARQLGKLMGEFRRASNEFRMQMEDELRVIEQEDRQKKIAAIEAAAPPQVALQAAAEPPAEIQPGTPATDLPAAATPAITVTEHTIAPPDYAQPATPSPATADPAASQPDASRPAAAQPATQPAATQPAATQPAATQEPLPIATSGSLRMMPPASGLPVARSAAGVSDAFDSIPEAPQPSPEAPSHA